MFKNLLIIRACCFKFAHNYEPGEEVKAGPASFSAQPGYCVKQKTGIGFTDKNRFIDSIPSILIERIN